MAKTAGKKATAADAEIVMKILRPAPRSGNAQGAQLVCLLDAGFV